VCSEVNDPGVSEQAKQELRLDLGVNDGLYTQKGDFIKLRDLSLSYALPTGVAQRAGATRARVTLAGHNLALLWKSEYTGLDPEVNFAGDNGPTGAWGLARVDYWTMPMTRRVTLAVDLTF
jgi:TonB-dependent starch-binding outer membrane protein SusC